MMNNVTIFTEKEMGFIGTQLNRIENTLNSYDKGVFDSDLTISEIKKALKNIRNVYR